ncbi:hypothetical protein TNCV_4273811 [Trichonephila clavipes]|nr:hypothetical protein TNCV_4273811 [Trichonephila clavipes]
MRSKYKDGLHFLTKGIGLIASRQEIPSLLVEATDGDSPLALALLVKATTGIGMSHALLVEVTAVSLLEPSEIANVYLLAIGFLVGYRGKSQWLPCSKLHSEEIQTEVFTVYDLACCVLRSSELVTNMFSVVCKRSDRVAVNTG